MGGADLTVSSAHGGPKVKNLLLVAAYSSFAEDVLPLAQVQLFELGQKEGSSGAPIRRERSKVETPARSAKVAKVWRRS
jgi:hypothetical protein